MTTLKHLFDNNLAWATAIKEKEPDFFSRLSKRQAPEYLWIGCSDSRVPPNQIVGLPPGEMFVHRNIANIVDHADLNCLAVLQFAVETLQVKHVIVCGHYGCGGVKAALEEKEHGFIDRWLRPIKEVRRRNNDKLSDLTVDNKVNALCELNVIEQVKNIRNSAIVQDVQKDGADLSVHGWVYNIKDGTLKDLNV